MDQKQLSVAVIGGGMGGLSAALALLQAGVDVHVYERVHTIREVGAGIAVSPNASRILYRLGLAEALESVGVRSLAWQYRRWEDGQTVSRVPIAGVLEARFGYPLYHVHRADLVKAMMAALPPERLHLGHNFTALIDHGDYVEAEFDNGVCFRGDALIGADGIHSMTREILFGPDRPHFTGVIAYRGLIPSERLAHLNLEATVQAWMGPGKQFVHYYVRNKRLVNFIAAIDQDTWTKESWVDPGEVADLLAAYAGWHPQVREIISAVDETFIWALFDRAPMQQWTIGRVTLLGDACHPMLPSKAQGAAQAIEDGAVLALCLAGVSAKDIPEAFLKYETLRKARVSRVQNEAQDNRVRFQLPDGPAQQARDAEMSQGGTDLSPEAVAWLFGYDPEKVEPIHPG